MSDDAAALAAFEKSQLMIAEFNATFQHLLHTEGLEAAGAWITAFSKTLTEVQRHQMLTSALIYIVATPLIGGAKL